MSQFLLHESASGYSLFEVTNADELAGEAVQQNVADIQRFGKAVKLSAFKPFTSAANALEQINAVSESQVSSGGGANAMHMPARPVVLLSVACWNLYTFKTAMGASWTHPGRSKAAAIRRRHVLLPADPATPLPS